MLNVGSTYALKEYGPRPLIDFNTRILTSRQSLGRSNPNWSQIDLSRMYIGYSSDGQYTSANNVVVNGKDSITLKNGMNAYGLMYPLEIDPSKKYKIVFDSSAGATQVGRGKLDANGQWNAYEWLNKYQIITGIDKLILVFPLEGGTYTNVSLTEVE